MRRMTLFLIWLTSALLLCSCRSRLPYEGKTADELERMLKDDDPQVQAQGAYGLSLDASSARQAVPALIEALSSKNASVRLYCARALGSAGTKARDAVPALTTALDDSAWAVRRQAALALGQMGRNALSALPALRRLAGQYDKPVREAAQQAIREIASAR